MVISRQRIVLVAAAALSLLGPAAATAAENPAGDNADIGRVTTIVRGESGTLPDEAFRLPAIRRDPQGRLWAAWQRWEGGGSRVELARFGAAGIETSLLMGGPEGDAVSPDLAFAPDGQPWLIWLDARAAETEVVVMETGSQRSWRLAAEPTTSIASPRIVFDDGGSPLALWNVTTPRSGEIAWRTLRAGTWTAAAVVPRLTAGPAISPDATTDARGTIWLVWSAYDGRDYHVYLSHRTGGGWSTEARVSKDEGPNLFPALGLDADGYPLVSWSRPSPAGGRLVSLTSLGRAGASAEYTIETPPGPPAPARIVPGEGGPAVCLKSGDGYRVESLTQIQLESAAASTAALQAPRLLGNLEFYENRYVGFGDSITFGYENYYPFPERGYVPRLETILNTQYGGQRVINEGFGGETTADGAVRIDKVFIADLARYILILDGTNDIVFSEIAIDTSDHNLREILRKCLAAGAFPAISTLLPRYDPTGLEPYFKNRILTLNARIRQAAADLSVPLVDMYTTYMNYPSAQGGVRALLSSDLKHPSDLGYQVMAETWFGGIRDFPFPPVNLAIEKLTPARNVQQRAKLAPTVSTTTGPFVEARQPMGNLLTWAQSPKILDPGMIFGYRIYKKKTAGAAMTYELLSLVEGQPLQFFEQGASVIGRSAYVISTVRRDGIEGPISDGVR